MSQLPNSNDIPSNSHAAQEKAKETNGDPKKPAIPEFKGEVAGAKRKKGFLRWMRKMFLSDQKPSDILKSVIENNVVPGIKDNFRNSMVTTMDSFIYQNSKPASQQTNNTIQYNNVYKNQNSTAVSRVNNQKPAQNPDQPDMSNGFTNPVFKTQAAAREFLNMMKSYDYPTLSVHTLYMMRRQHIDYTWDAYGWTREELVNVQITHINNPEWPWMIDLPQAHVIN